MLQGAVQDDWDLVIQHAPQPRTPVLFYAAVEEWKAELILPSACQTMVNYLETLMKPRNMTNKAFANRVKVMVCYINTPFQDQTLQWSPLPSSRTLSFEPCL
jgi:hypothetical protein